MSVDNVRIGFVGCGGIAQGHLRRLVEHPAAQVVAVCDVNPGAALAASELTSGTVYNDYSRMLESEEIDAAYICLPPFAHGGIEHALIEKDIPFFVQKPVALGLKEANAVAAGVRDKNLLTCVGYQLRYSDTTDKARELLQDSTIGLVRGNYWCGTGRATVGRWIQRYDHSAGQLVEQATHTLDMMRYLAGEVDSVFSYQDQRLLDPANTDCPDVYSISLRFENGAVGSFSSTWALDGGDWAEANIVDIVFDEKRLRWNYDKVKVTYGQETEEFGGAHGSIDDVFIEAVRTGDRSAILSDYDDAMRTLAISLAANESARTGAPVNIARFIADQS